MQTHYKLSDHNQRNTKTNISLKHINNPTKQNPCN